MQRVAAPPFRAFFRLRTRGREHVPRSGGVLLCPNHASYLDPWFVGYALPERSWRNLITDEWYDRNAVLRRMFRAWGTIPQTTGDPDATIARVVEAVGSGEAVTMFPEGGLSRDGRLHRGRSGVAIAAALTGAPVLPCAVLGNYRTLPPHRLVPRRGPVEVRVGAPMRFPDPPRHEPPHRTETRAFATALMEAIADLAEGALGPPAR